MALKSESLDRQTDRTPYVAAHTIHHLVLDLFFCFTLYGFSSFSLSHIFSPSISPYFALSLSPLSLSLSFCLSVCLSLSVYVCLYLSLFHSWSYISHFSFKVIVPHDNIRSNPSTVWNQHIYQCIPVYHNISTNVGIKSAAIIIIIIIILLPSFSHQLADGLSSES